MKFGLRVPQLRLEKELTQRQLAERIGVSISYISNVKNEALHFGDYPSAKFIHKMAEELDADEDELLILADKVPEAMRRRIRERPEAFRRFAELDDDAMDKLFAQESKAKPANQSIRKKVR